MYKRQKLYSPGHKYLKAGIGLIELVDRNHHQYDLLQPDQSARTDKLMNIIDAINKREGKGSLFLAAQGINKPWAMRQQYTSPQYTTKWEDILVVRC